MTLSVLWDFVVFWFVLSPKNLIAFFSSFNSAFLQLFSLPLLLKTFFRPWKNEYRQGLVGFSIAMGMFIKTFVILADTFLFALILSAEVLLVLVFLAWPFATIFLLLY